MTRRQQHIKKNTLALQKRKRKSQWVPITLVICTGLLGIFFSTLFSTGELGPQQAYADSRSPRGGDTTPTPQVQHPPISLPTPVRKATANPFLPGPGQYKPVEPSSGVTATPGVSPRGVEATSTATNSFAPTDPGTSAGQTATPTPSDSPTPTETPRPSEPPAPSIADFLRTPGFLSGWPVSGAVVSQPFGCTGFYLEPSFAGCPHFHGGIDLAVPEGTPVYATLSGLATAKVSPNGFGLYITISNGTYSTRYAHMRDVSPMLGITPGSFEGSMSAIALQTQSAYVSRGQLLGYVGVTGRSTGPHVHYEVHYLGTYMVPPETSLDSPTGFDSPLLVASDTTPQAGSPDDKEAKAKGKTPGTPSGAAKGPYAPHNGTGSAYFSPLSPQLPLASNSTLSSGGSSSSSIIAPPRNAQQGPLPNPVPGIPVDSTQFLAFFFFGGACSLMLLRQVARQVTRVDWADTEKKGK